MRVITKFGGDYILKLSESLSNSWLELMGIDSSKFKIIMVDENVQRE